MLFILGVVYPLKNVLAHWLVGGHCPHLALHGLLDIGDPLNVFPVGRRRQDPSGDLDLGHSIQLGQGLVDGRLVVEPLQGGELGIPAGDDGIELTGQVILNGFSG